MSLRKLLCLVETLAFGGRWREAVLLGILGSYYRSRLRRHWVWQCGGEAHFSDHRASGFEFVFSADPGFSGYGLYRGFLAAELIRDGDSVLDIGCGDGFLTRRFCALRAASVDAIDIEPTAIAMASVRQNGSNIRYQCLDATKQSFPRERYDVIVWDGAIGHFAADDIDAMLSKISRSVGSDGVFCGSESLGLEGHDHLTYFHTLDDLGTLLRKHFSHVELRSVEYPVGLFRSKFLRTEALWRCANDRTRLSESTWKSY